jgi:hypothetical protein
MEFPDDVLALIREYSRPLKRREVSKYWRDKKMFDLDVMAVSVLNKFIGLGCDYVILKRDGNTWEISNITTFTDTDLLKWNGEINEGQNGYDPIGYRGNHEYLWEDPIRFKQLLNGTQIIKEKLISFYTPKKIKPRNRV